MVFEFNLALVTMERGDYALARERFEAKLVRAEILAMTNESLFAQCCC